MNYISPRKLNLENVDGIPNLILDDNNAVVISQKSQIFLDIFIKNCIEYETNYAFKRIPDKRMAALIVTRNKDYFNQLIDYQVNTEEIFEYSNGYRKFLQNNNVFCEIDSPSFSFVYWSHHLINYYGSNLPAEIPLHFIFPVGKGRHDYQIESRGYRNTLGRVDNNLQPVFIFSDVITTAYDQSLDFDYIFIDGTTVKKPIKKSELTSNAVILIESYFDFRLPYIFGDNNKVYGLEEYDTKNIAFKYIESKFEAEIKEAFTILKVLKNEEIPNLEIKLINKILYNILRTSIEGVEYDFIAKFSLQGDMVRDLINELRESDYRYSNRNLARIIHLIEDIYNKHLLDSFCPKYDELINFCEKVIKNRETVLVVASSKIDSIGLKEKIANHFKLDINDLVDYGIEVVTHYDALKMKKSNFDNVIVTSAVRFEDLSLLIRPLGEKKVVLLYELEIRELKSKLFSMTLLKNDLRQQGNELSSNLLYEELYRKLKNADINGKKLISNLEIADLISSIETKYVDYSIRLTRPYSGDNAVKAKLITFEDGCKMFMRLGSLIQYRKKSTKKVEKKYVKDLKLQDEIIIIDGNAREDIYRIFIKGVSAESESAQHYEIIKKWNYIYEDKFIFMKLNINDLYDKMISNGWNKTTKSILNNWKSGFSFGPRDKNDIECLGKALDIGEFKNNAEYYHFSMRYIRNERRAAAKILNKIIFYSNRKVDEDDSSVLERYNLTIEEIREVVSVNKVKSISNQTYAVKPIEIGILFAEER